MRKGSLEYLELQALTDKANRKSNFMKQSSLESLLDLIEEAETTKDLNDWHKKAVKLNKSLDIEVRIFELAKETRNVTSEKALINEDKETYVMPNGKDVLSLIKEGDCLTADLVSQTAILLRDWYIPRFKKTNNTLLESVREYVKCQ